MTLNFAMMFLAILPIVILGQLARSWRLPRPQRHSRADLVEAVGLALGISFASQSSALFPQWHPLVAFILLFAAAYFPVCFLADWMRKKPRHDA
jgi:hypothetical protein